MNDTAMKLVVTVYGIPDTDSSVPLFCGVMPFELAMGTLALVGSAGSQDVSAAYPDQFVALHSSELLATRTGMVQLVDALTEFPEYDYTFAVAEGGRPVGLGPGLVGFKLLIPQERGISVLNGTRLAESQLWVPARRLAAEMSLTPYDYRVIRLADASVLVIVWRQPE